MKIKVNGKEKDLDFKSEKALLSSTIDYLGYNPKTIIVELNDLVINSKKWEKETIKDGDRLEIVSIVGGG